MREVAVSMLGLKYRLKIQNNIKSTVHCNTAPHFVILQLSLQEHDLCTIKWNWLNSEINDMKLTIIAYCTEHGVIKPEGLQAYSMATSMNQFHYSRSLRSSLYSYAYIRFSQFGGRIALYGYDRCKQLVPYVYAIAACIMWWQKSTHPPHPHTQLTHRQFCGAWLLQESTPFHTNYSWVEKDRRKRQNMKTAATINELPLLVCSKTPMY